MNVEQLETIIDRYLAGEATAEEKVFIARWLAPTPRDADSPEPSRKQVIEAALWQHVALRSGVNISTDAPQTGRLRTLLQQRSWWRYAAAVVILVAAGVAGYKTVFNKPAVKYQVIAALPGKPKKLLLPDSSTVHLFPGATISIPDNYNQSDRSITATGRVFYEIKPDASRPFYVQAGLLRTRVLGTSFEVMANDSLHASVIVRTGKVGVQHGSQHLADLTPGKRLRYDVQQNNTVIDEVNAAMLCEWWNHGMVYSQAPLEDVIKALSDWYNIPIEIINNKWKSEPVTIRIKEHDLPEALSLLSQTLGFSFRQQNRKVFIY